MKVVAIIVTYNRSKLLLRAIEAVRRQTYSPAEILIVDNASIDDTRDVIERLGDAVVPIYLSRNTGGAGGFHIGTTNAMERGADFVWVMDDDGAPDPACLEVLVNAAGRFYLDMAGPLVVAEDDPTELPFRLNRLKRGAALDCQTVDEARAASHDGIIPNNCLAFNGVLIRASAIREIGPVRAEMFIWGDEIDFTSRMVRKHKAVATVVSALHLHPRSKMVSERVPLFGMKQFQFPPRGREVYHYRNQSYNLTHNHGVSALKAIIVGVRLAGAMILKGRLRTALMMPLWWLDGMFDLYLLPPSRRHLLRTVADELARIRRGCKLESPA